MKPRRDPAGADAATLGHDALKTVRELEASIAARRAAIETTKAAVVEARSEAERIRADARTHADAKAARVREEVLAAGRAETDALRERTDAELTRMTSKAAASRDRWVEDFARRVLGQHTASGSTGADHHAGGTS